MAFHGALLKRAERDVRAIVDWLAHRSPRGATRWVEVLEKAIDELRRKPLAYALADAMELADLNVRNIAFQTRAGRRYRILFTVIDNEVRVLHVRGPAQAPWTTRDILDIDS